MITLLIWILVMGLICYLVLWALGAMGAPQPIRVVVIVIFCIIGILLLAQFLPALHVLSLTR